MHPLPEPQPRQRRYNVRCQARLDAETQAKLVVPRKTFHRKHAQILRQVMRWALAHTEGWTIDPSIPDRPYLVHTLVEPELLQQVQDAAAARRVSVAAWVRLELDAAHSGRGLQPAGSAWPPGCARRCGR